MNRICQSLLLLLLCCLLSQKASSQDAMFFPDTKTQTAAEDSMIRLYHQFVQPETNLYNGIEYLDYSSSIQDGSPFYRTKEALPNKVLYNGVWYQNIPLLYDEVKNLVVIANPTHNRKMSLHSEKVSEFTVDNHHFIRLIKDSIHQSIIQTGFYDLLYDGNLILVKKPSKSVQENSTLTEGFKKYIIESNSYFVRKEGVYHEVNNKAAVLSLFPKKKKEIARFIKRKKIRFSGDKEAALVQVIAYCNSL